MPEALVEQLADGGVMLLPLGPHDGTQHIVKLTKIVKRASTREELIAGAFRAAAAGTGEGIVNFAVIWRRASRESTMSIASAGANLPVVLNAFLPARVFHSSSASPA